MMACRRRTTTRTNEFSLVDVTTTTAIILLLSLLLSTTSIITSSSSSSFCIVVKFAESFCNNSPLKLQPSRHCLHRHSNKSSSKIKIKVLTTTIAATNKSVLLLDVVAADDDGRRRNNVINSQDYININNDVIETSSSSLSTSLTTSNSNHATAIINRRDLFGNIASAITTCAAAAMTMTVGLIRPVYAYTPDPDKLQESLYFISRVQEATVQQERFITNAYNQNTNTTTNQSSAKVLQSKLKLTLLLVEKNYKLLDQINYCSQYIQPEEKLIVSSEAGYQAVEELQNAIDYVRNDENWNNNHNDNNSGGAVTEQQYTYLISSLTECRDQLFLFLLYIEPNEKLNIARLRVENENVQNRIEFGDADDIDDNQNAGVYNPVLLPWK